MSFSISHYNPALQTTVVPLYRIFRPKTLKQNFNLSALSFLLDPEPNPDPKKGSGPGSPPLAKRPFKTQHGGL